MGVHSFCNAMIKIKNADLAGKEFVEVKATKLLEAVLKIMQREGYIGEFEYIEDGKQGIFKIKLLKRINECKGVSPRFPAKKDEIEKYEQRYLPSRDMGIMFISTSQGVMTHKEAKEKKIGGRIIGYVY